ncbi:MAG: hypothetical protein LBP58_09615 [Azoarcus sp.]|jgi:hypothetical protein|nr:hypothetical protein [Azoarcus sp.]
MTSGHHPVALVIGFRWEEPPPCALPVLAEQWRCHFNPLKENKKKEGK